MKIPALRAHIGDWVYYLATMRFEDVSTYVRKIDQELHSSELLKQALQRSITSNYKSIAHYIETQNERFFNALVLAVYDGDPTWHEVRLEYDDGEEFYNLGVLELNEDVKIFPVDGQHRVEGIKEVVRKNDCFNNEQVPVIFIGHKTTEAGMQRSRRLFSTLNRYAKPVSLRDIIALDEDDVVAIASRDLIDSHPLFSGARLFDAKTKAIPDSNNTAFTTIITFYECNYELLWLLIKDMDVRNADNDPVRGRSKLREFIRRRPSAEFIEQFTSLCHTFWNAVINSYADIRDYLSEMPNTQQYRNHTGGNLLFRPVSLIPFVKAFVKVSSTSSDNFEQVLSQLPIQLLSMGNIIWRNVIWNAEKGTMIMNHQPLTERILLYYWNKQLLTIKQIEDMKLDIKSLRQLMDMEDVDALLSFAVE